MEKSHVSMEQHQCIVCGALYDTGSLLLDRKMRASMAPTTVTGTGLCPEHQKLKDDGYIALIEADEKTHQRTGRLAHVRASVWPKLFNMPESEAPAGGVAYVSMHTMDTLERISKP
jgi:hypothetical protein